MFFLGRIRKRGQMVSWSVIKWIISIALIIVVGVAIREILKRASG